MRKYLRRSLELVLKALAKLTIWRYRPGIVGVTGSVGKTSTKIAIASVLSSVRKVRSSPDSHNNQIGLPLTILGEWSESDLRLVSKNQPEGINKIEKVFFWIKVLGLSVWRILKKSDYPEILVLEYGADRPGDIKYLLSIARPNFSVITAIGEIPVHVEYYSGPDEVAREKVRLIESLGSSGTAVLNHDDEAVMNLKDRTRANVITYGFTKGSDMQIVGLENRIIDGKPQGIGFRIEYGGSAVSIRLEECFGKAQAYSAAAAACVGVAFGINLSKISQALESYRTASGRMELVPGIKASFLINDAFNASPLSMMAGLDALYHLEAKRKVAILGDMLELGKYSIPAHEKIGEVASRFIDLLVTVGPRAKFIADAANKNGLNRRYIKSYEQAEEALRELPDIIKKGDLILIKGSHAMNLDSVVEGLRDTLNTSQTV